MFKGVIVKNEKVKALLAESSNGIITTKQVTDAGLHRGILLCRIICWKVLC